MSISKALLAILVCPISKQPVFMLHANKLSHLNKAILEQQLTTRAGETVREPLQDALITRNQTTIYPVVDGIAVMLEDRAIEVDKQFF